MFRHPTRTVIAAAALLTTPVHAQVPAGLADQVLECAQLTVDEKRLNCFDEVAGAISTVPEKFSSPTQADNKVMPAASAAVVAATPGAKSEAPPVPTSEGVDAAIASVVALPIADARNEQQLVLDEFGMNAELASEQPERKTEGVLKEISAKVVEVRKRGYGEHVVTLDNGQIWAEKRNENSLRIKVGDTVRIKRNKFGGYRIIGNGNRSSPAKRIQ